MGDIQQSMLRRAIAPHLDRIDAADNPMAELAKVTCESVQKMMVEIAHTGFGPGQLALVGGILINMPEGYSDYGVPYHFTIQHQQSPVEDILYKLKMDTSHGPGGSSSSASAAAKSPSFSFDLSGLSPEQMEFMKRKQQEADSSSASPATSGSGDMSGLSPDQIEFMRRKQREVSRAR